MSVFYCACKGTGFMKKKYNVQTALQAVLFLIMTASFIIYLAYYVIYESAKISSQASESLKQQVQSVQTLTDSELVQLDTVMQNVAYSNLVKEYYLALNNSKSSDNGNYSSMQNAKVLASLLTAIIGPNRSVDQIYLYGLEAGAFGIGLDNSNEDQSVQDMPWYGKLQESEQNKIMFIQKDERLSKYYTYEEGSLFLTLCSVFQNSRFHPIGVIETKRSVSALTRNLGKMDHNSYRESVYIFDPYGSLVYASGETEKAEDIYGILSGPEGADTEDGRTGSSVSHLNRGGTHYFSTISGYSGFTTAAVVSNRNLYEPLFKFLRINLLLFLCSILLAFLLCRALAKRFTNPFRKMYLQLTNLHKTTENGFTDEVIRKTDTSLKELDTLYTAFIDMHDRLQESARKEVNLRNQEVQSRMLALQSQMNPHFLYNSLATIQSLADEHLDDSVIRMCQMISRILRYISSDSEPLVPIRDDVSHARDYLECMKLRYEEDLVYSIRIPEEMMDRLIPKLSLQLIIENAIKFSTRSVRPPWIVRIEGTVTEKGWEIAILDNGSGFNEKDLKELEEKIEYIDRTQMLPSLEIDGMGLMNIYIRFRTYYHEKQIFRIGNREEGGAFIVVGAQTET